MNIEHTNDNKLSDNYNNNLCVKVAKEQETENTKETNTASGALLTYNPSAGTSRRSGNNYTAQLLNLLDEYGIRSDDVMEFVEKYFHTNYLSIGDSGCAEIYKIIKECIKDKKLSLTLLEKAGNNYYIEQAKDKYKLNDELFKDKDFKVEYLENAIKAVDEEIKSGKTDSKNKNKKIREYIIAQNYQWSIEGFNKYNVKKVTIRQKIIDYYKNTDKNIRNKVNNANSKDLIVLAKNMFTKMFTQLAKIKKEEFDKNPEFRKEYGSVENYIDKSYKQTIGKLLINTLNANSKKDYDSIVAAATAFKPEERIKIIRAVIGASFDNNNQALTENISNITVQQEKSDDIKEAKDSDNITKEATESVSPNKYNIGNSLIENIEEITDGMSDKQISEMVNIAATHADLKIIQNKRNKIDNEANDEYNKNGEITENVKQKSTISSNLTVEVLNHREYSDETAVEDAKHFNELLKKNPTLYRAEAKSISNIIRQNKSITPEKQKKLVAQLNIITNGNYAKLENDNNCELNPPVDTEAMKKENNGIGIKPQKGVNVESSANNVAELKETITQQSTDDTEVSQITVDNTETVPEREHTTGHKESFFNATSFAEAYRLSPLGSIAHRISSISVDDIREFSIELTPLIKHFSELTLSVQEHIKTRLESRSEDEQIHSIDQMDKNSDKVDLALQLKISSDKLKELHLDTNAKKNLELQEEIA